MTSPRIRLAVLVSLAVAWVGGCGGNSPTAAKPPAGAWTLEQTAVVEGFDTPECVVVDPARDAVYVANIAPTGGDPWSQDGKAFLSLLKSGGQVDKLSWKTSTAEMPLNSPKGMCIANDVLYVADINRVVTYPLAGGEPGQIVIEGAERLNDMAAHKGATYVSDTGTGKIWRLEPGRKPLAIQGPPGANGITFAGDRMFAVSWGEHDVYEMDPTGKGEPKPFGLAGHFEGLDGIEVLADGTFLVTDLPTNKVCSISPDRKTVTVLARPTTPADIGLDRKRMLLYVPEFDQGKVVVYRIAKR